jgi:hypothetical protein
LYTRYIYAVGCMSPTLTTLVNSALCRSRVAPNADCSVIGNGP